ncbi:MAG: hypothetical protein JO063_09590 [Pseudonocardiales bacterium]|nr:hypothetical protein [Pseudonocardiales bacterium]MBW0010350.1 hypothetical protein [Pseudonocardiales bacterium]
MRDVMTLRDARQAAIRGHPFFEWLHNETVPLTERLQFAPMGAFFIMQFRDMNRWVLRFPQPRDEFEWVINFGTYEDEKHSRLFLEDWRKLGLDQRLGWRASDTLWWLFLSPDQEVFRRSGIEFTALAVEDGGDALIRFGHSEAGEATGHVMLGNTAKIATLLSQETGLDYRYFGTHHLDLETGHVANIEGIFEETTLDPGRRAKAREMCGRMFDIFERIFDGFLAYARDYLDSGRVPRRPGTPRRAAADWVAPPLEICPADHRDEMVYRRLQQRKARVAAHPFYGWLCTDNGLSPRQKLQRFLPMWIMDVMGYRDLNKYAMPYPGATDPAKLAVSRWASRLSAHSDLLLCDWDALGLDELLGYTASQTLEFLFLDQDMDLHREHMIEFGKLALRYTDPALRWWMLAALESTGERFFAHAQPLARAVEAETGAKLDYLCGRHDPAERADDTGGEHNGVPPARLRPETLDVAIGLVDHVFDSMESQLWRSLALARANRFNVG